MVNLCIFAHVCPHIWSYTTRGRQVCGRVQQADAVKGHSIDCGAGGAYEKDTQVSRGVEEVQDHGRHWQERYKYKTGRATHLLSSTTFEMTQRHTNTVAWLEEIQLHGRLAHTTSGQQRGRGTEERLAQPFEKGSEVQVQWRTVMLIRGPCASLLRRAVLPT